MTDIDRIRRDFRAGVSTRDPNDDIRDLLAEVDSLETRAENLRHDLRREISSANEWQLAAKEAGVALAGALRAIAERDRQLQTINALLSKPATPRARPTS